MACVFWQDEWETKVGEFMKKIKSWRYYEDYFGGMWRWRKAEVLSMRFQEWRRISKINSGVCHGKLRGQDISKDTIEMHREQNGSLLMPRKIHLLNPREKEVIKS